MPLVGLKKGHFWTWIKILFHNSSITEKLQSPTVISVWPHKHLWWGEVKGHWFHPAWLCCPNPRREKRLIQDLHPKSITGSLAPSSACLPWASEVWTFLFGNAGLTASPKASRSNHSSVYHTDSCSVNHLRGTNSQMYCTAFLTLAVWCEKILQSATYSTEMSVMDFTVQLKSRRLVFKSWKRKMRDSFGSQQLVTKIFF